MNSFKDVTLIEAKLAGCDTCQIKYKGLWTRNEVSRGLMRSYSAHLDTGVYEDVPEGVNATLIGNAGVGVTYIFDCWMVDGNDVRKLGYRDRYALAHVNLRELNVPTFQLVKNFPIMAAREVWNGLMTDATNGIIFRKSTDLWNGPVLCQRYYPETPAGLA